MPRSTTGRCRPNTPRTRSPTPWAASSPTIRCRPRTSWTSSCGPATRDSSHIPSGRFFGFVIGGSHPAAIAADWLTTVWDQNAGLRALTPASAALEEVAGAWILEALSLPPESAVGYVTGGTTANFTCLATGRDTVLRTAGYDVSHGLAALPPVQVVAGAERHASIDLAARYLGLGTPESVPVDEQGRIRPDELERVLADRSGLTIVALQAGNIHSGAFDPFPACIEIARRHGAWIHVDGAFGLWAAASPSFEHLTVGLAGADSWATDAHKTLNVPYDCGLAIVRDREAMATSMAMHGDYLIESPVGDPQERVPELSRRARGTPVWAVLRSLGRSGLDGPRRPIGGPCERVRGCRRPPARCNRRERRGLHAGVHRVRGRRRPPSGSRSSCWTRGPRG